MLYVPSINVGFLHVQKAAGTSFQNFLRASFKDASEFSPLKNAHYRIKDIFTEFPYAKTWQIVTLFRDPLALHVSRYYYWRTQTWNNEPKYITKSRSLPFCDFITLIEDNIDQIWNYEQIVTINNNTPKQLSILKLENILEDLNQYFNVKLCLNIPIFFPHNHITPHPPVLDHYNETLAERIYKLESFVYNMGWYQKRKLENIESEK